jgi:methyltransferase family protein
VVRPAAPFGRPDRGVPEAGRTAHRRPAERRRGARGCAGPRVPGHRAGATRVSCDRAGHQPFVRGDRENARRAAVRVDFRQGDAASLPFEAESFDLVVCQAAFKNFRSRQRPRRAAPSPAQRWDGGDPGHAQGCVRRGHRPGGEADGPQSAERLHDQADADDAPAPRLLASPVRAPCRRQRLGTCSIQTEGIGMEVRLTKRGPTRHDQRRPCRGRWHGKRHQATVCAW